MNRLRLQISTVFLMISIASWTAAVLYQELTVESVFVGRTVGLLYLFAVPIGSIVGSVSALVLLVVRPLTRAQSSLEACLGVAVAALWGHVTHL